MDARIKVLWMEDLRAHPELQGHGSLRDGDTFCCLGRLCELYRIETGRARWNWKDGKFCFIDESDYDDAYLTDGVCEWAGVERIPCLNGKEAATWNDETEVGFIGIAQMIEEEL